MTYLTLLAIFLGLACIVVGAMLPVTAAYTFPAGAALLGLAIPLTRLPPKDDK